MFNQLKEIYKGQVDWDDSTIILYIFIVVFATFSAWIASRHNINNKKTITWGPLFTLSFLVFFIFLVLRDVGTDLPMYRIIYNNCVLDSSYFNNQEPGFLILNRIIRFFNFGENVAIGIFGLLTVYLYYYSIKYYSKHIDVALAVFAYGCMYYFQSYSLIRIYLASAIILYAFKYIITSDYKKYIWLNILTVFIHYSAILAFIPFTYYYIYIKRKSWFIPVYILSILLSTILVNNLSSITLFARYDEYLSGGMMKGGIGLFQIAINIPPLCLYFYCKRRIKGSVIPSLLIIYTISSLFIGIISYKILMLGRSLVYYNIIYIVCIPWIIKYLKVIKDKNYNIIKVSFYIYFFWRFYQYLSEYLLFDNIMPYRFLKI